MDSKCIKCGNEDDFWVAFMEIKVCGKCIEKIHHEATKDLYN
jgi:hypothetical protein